jgi:hypothetical protein
MHSLNFNVMQAMSVNSEPLLLVLLLLHRHRLFSIIVISEKGNDYSDDAHRHSKA